MTNSFFRDTYFGAAVRLLSGNKYFRYHEDCPGFKFPDEYCKSQQSDASPASSASGAKSPCSSSSDREAQQDATASTHSPTDRNQTQGADGADVEKQLQQSSVAADAKEPATPSEYTLVTW